MNAQEALTYGFSGFSSRCLRNKRNKWKEENNIIKKENEMLKLMFEDIRRSIDGVKKELEELKTEIRWMPGSRGFQEAKEHFEMAKNLQTNDFEDWARNNLD